MGLRASHPYPSSDGVWRPRIAACDLRTRRSLRAVFAFSTECEMKVWSMALAVVVPALVAMGSGSIHSAPAAGGLAPAAADTILPPKMIALGDSIFHGRVDGGRCFTCHGSSARGTPGIAPDLTDARWLHGDGTYGFIITVVANGVPKPMHAAAPMPPDGGAKLSMAQVLAVSAFVYSLSDTVR